MARPVDAKKFLRDLRKDARAQGMVVERDTRRGAGSHYFVVIIKPGSPRRATFTLPDQKEISPGVQRQIVSWCRELARECSIHAVVYEILKKLFGL